jgi:hypothetical protein
MSAFYGGRAEARIVRTPSPSFSSRRLKTVDTTERVRELLADPDLGRALPHTGSLGELGVMLVELEPDGDVLPTRARYDPAGNDYGIGVKPLSYEGRLWYALPDVVAAAILNPVEYGTANVPCVVRAIRLEPVADPDGCIGASARWPRDRPAHGRLVRADDRAPPPGCP